MLRYAETSIVGRDTRNPLLCGQARDLEFLAAALGAKVAQQAVYNTQAARILGQVTTDPVGALIQFAPYGHAFVPYDVQGQRQTLRHAMLRTGADVLVVQALIWQQARRVVVRASS